MKVVYFVQDLNDPAVSRRVRMLLGAGATVGLLGFSRGDPPRQVEGITPLTLGHTEDARFVQRGIAVLQAALATRRWQTVVSGADLIIARQLESLILACLARSRHAPGTPVVFECLDIHRLMVGSGFVGRILRAIERGRLSKCRALLVSSQEFVDAYFARAHANLPAVIVVENKVLASELDDPSAPATLRSVGRMAGPPWRIGWYGIIRCAESLRLLADLTRRFPGLVEVVIRGRVATKVLPDFDSVVASCPGLSFAGPYDRRHDLARLYGDVHFAWAIDFYEAGANSDWLLPNRLYESGLFGAVPIARSDVATGRWLSSRGVGALVQGDLTQALAALFQGLDAARYRALALDLASLPESNFLYTASDCKILLQQIAGKSPPAAAEA